MQLFLRMGILWTDIIVGLPPYLLQVGPEVELGGHVQIDMPGEELSAGSGPDGRCVSSLARERSHHHIIS